jgi:hypothetical protein
MLACLRFAGLVAETVARLTTGSAGLTLGRAGFAPAGRQIEISRSHRISSNPNRPVEPGRSGRFLECIGWPQPARYDWPMAKFTLAQKCEILSETRLFESLAEWGDLVGATRESVNKQFRVWGNERLIALEKGKVVILEVDEVEKLADCVVV